jgi:hypothetical protein
MLIGFDRMSIQDVHLLIAQARTEADNPAFKVYPSTSIEVDVTEFIRRHIFPYMSVLVGSHALVGSERDCGIFRARVGTSSSIESVEDTV